MPINKHDDSLVVIYKNDERGNRDFSATQLNIYRGNGYIVDNDPGKLRVAVQFQGGQASVEVQRSELLEALGITPALLNDLAQALKVHDDTDSLPLGDDEQADQAHARRGDTVALAAEALMKAVQQ